MGILDITNSHAGWLTLWLEPLGEDRWMRPGETFRIRSDYDGDERDFLIDLSAGAKARPAGIENVTVSIERGSPYARVTDDSGNVVECGHQRPAEIHARWTRITRSLGQP